jgi:glucokinase
VFEHVRDYNSSESLFKGICSQIQELLNKNNIGDNQIHGISIACPGPLDSENGIILDTPNLTLFRNYALKDRFKKQFDCKVLIENDANLFALGEWFLSHQEEKVFIGVTLGTGLGFGLIFNGEMFTGKNGMAADYGLSFCEWGIWEDKISLKYLRSEIEKIYGERVSPNACFSTSLGETLSP